MASKAYDTDRQTNEQGLTHRLVGTRLIAWLPLQILQTNRLTDTYSRARCQAGGMASKPYDTDRQTEGHSFMGLLVPGWSDDVSSI